MSEIPFAVHNPALLPADVLLGEFTARGTLLTTLLRIVRQNVPRKPHQHVVLVGARGMGKTTTLWAVAHSIAGEPELARRWQPVVFDEESRRVGDLTDFWLEAIRQWEFATHSSEGKADRLLGDAGADLEERARSVFLNAVDRSGKRVVLLIDNLNEVFAAISEPEALHRLRAFLMEDDRVMVLGAATRHFEAITGLNEPFFDFFRIFELLPLTLEEMQTTLLTLAERRGDTRVSGTIEQRPGTIRSLHVLTGGNPRLVKTFYRLLAEGLRGDVRQDLERLVDEFTPYFKAILDALPMQQQRIVDAVALAWEPVEVAAIAQATRLPSNQVSAQMIGLKRSGIVTEAAGSPKRKAYLLADRFSNIHYLMRHGRTARRRFDWFVLTLRALFPDPEQANALARVAVLTACAGTEGIRDTRDLLTSALAWADDENSRRRIIYATIKETWDQESLARFGEWLDLEVVKKHLPRFPVEWDIVTFFGTLPAELRKSLGYKPESANWWVALAKILEQKEAWILADGAYRKAIELYPKQADAWYGLGRLLSVHLARAAEAESALLRLVELCPDSVAAWNGLGNVLVDTERQGEGEAAYRRAIALGPERGYAHLNLADLLGRQGRHSEAEVLVRAAIGIDPNYGPAWNALGTALFKSARNVEAEDAYRRAIEIDPNDCLPWSNLGVLLVGQRRMREALDAYRKAVELNPPFATPYYGLAALLSEVQGENEEMRALATKGLALEPADAGAQSVYSHLCEADATSWHLVLPALAVWVATHPKDAAVFDFALNGFIRYAQLTSEAAASKLLETVPDPQPLEILCDAFRAHSEPEHLHRLAPERRTLVLEVLNRISSPSRSKQKKRARKPASPRTKRQTSTRS
jgi:tetratricopeptide (TPR) repeat protein